MHFWERPKPKTWKLSGVGLAEIQANVRVWKPCLETTELLTLALPASNGLRYHQHLRGSQSAIHYLDDPWLDGTTTWKCFLTYSDHSDCKSLWVVALWVLHVLNSSCENLNDTLFVLHFLLNWIKLPSNPSYRSQNSYRNLKSSSATCSLRAWLTQADSKSDTPKIPGGEPHEAGVLPKDTALSAHGAQVGMPLSKSWLAWLQSPTLVLLPHTLSK